MRFAYTPYWSGDWSEEPSTSMIDIEGLSADDYISNVTRWERTFWEIELLEDIATRGPRGGVYLDIGANVGNHSIYFAKFLADYVVAVEPNPQVVPVLQRNLRANNIRNCRVVANAVGERTGVGRMVPSGDDREDHGTKRVRAENSGTIADADPSRVPISTLDRTMAEVESELTGRSVTLCKIDVEGMELEALQGAQTLLKEHRPQLVVEANTGEALSRLTSYLSGLGYRRVGQFPNTPTYYFINPAVHHLRTGEYDPEQVEARRLYFAKRDISRLIPSGNCFIFVDQDEWGLDDLPGGRRIIPFVEREGEYWGPPADDATAIAELERLRRSGANFIVFARPAFWWLEYYPEFRDYLKARYGPMIDNDRLTIFDLRQRLNVERITENKVLDRQRG